ncbi:ABC transporter permease [Isoptericola croceus]|uniref:ABC transporter permease n=1 Tax=Isoptericola croceus TaxID=3031406 RepID=UPI0023F8915F|nr:ABC transporter permease [Isoptericola croceus]
MTAPRPVRALVVANLSRQVRDKVGMFFVVVMPFVTILFVGMALGTGGSALPVGVVADDGDATARLVLAELETNEDLEITRADTADEVRADVRNGRLAAGLIIPSGSSGLELVMTPSSGSGMAARGAIDVAVGKAAAVLEATSAAEAAGAAPDDAVAYVEEAQSDAVAVSIESSGDQGEGDAPTGFAYTAPANLLLFTFINSMAVAAALVESRRLGMIRRALVAPVRSRQVLAGEAVSRFLVALAQSLLIIVVSSLLFGVQWGDPFGVTAVVVLFCLIATGAAMMVGAWVKQPQQAPAIGMPIGIVLGMLGGCLWPREVAGDALSTIGYVSPHTWAMDALLTLADPGTGITSILPELAVLAGMAVLALGVAVVAFRRRAMVTG